MDNGNETASRQCRFLSEGDFEALYQTFTEAFSDYVFPFALTETQFRNHINLTAVDLDRTVGCFEGDKLVGFSLNGFGVWQGISTVYDAGTGVILSCRRQGVAEAMFDFMLPVFKEQGIGQFLLEVVTTNIGAINFYKKLGFLTVRELALLQCDTKPGSIIPTNEKIEITDLTEPDWDLLTTFWDCDPSWQNSVDAVKRSLKLKRIKGAYVDGRCVGYIVFSSRFGRVAQFAVASEHRRVGIGRALVHALKAETEEGFSTQVINIDKSIPAAMRFFASNGYYERISQYEMVKQM